MTAVLPLTEDEERALRAHWEDSPTWAQEQIGRLLATLDAERARVRGRAFVPIGTKPLTPEAQAAWDQGMAEREELTRPSPSRSDARRIAAQRGESAPVFGTAGAVERKGRPHTFWATHRDAEPTGTPCSCSWGADHGDGKYVEEEYPAPIVEAVRALERIVTDEVGCVHRDGDSRGRGPFTCADRGEKDVCSFCIAAAALASLPKELRDAAAEKKAYR